MIRLIRFKNDEREYGWNGCISNSAVSRFNRWMDANQENLVNMNIIHSDNDIIVQYELFKGSSMILSDIIEEGVYTYNMSEGILVHVDTGIDISYMISDKEGFLTMIDKIDLCTPYRTTKHTLFQLKLVDGNFVIKYWFKDTKLVTQPLCWHTDPVTVNESTYFHTPVTSIINKRYIPYFSSNRESLDIGVGNEPKLKLRWGDVLSLSKSQSTPSKCSVFLDRSGADISDMFSQLSLLYHFRDLIEMKNQPRVVVIQIDDPIHSHQGLVEMNEVIEKLLTEHGKYARISAEEILKHHMKWCTIDNMVAEPLLPELMR